MKRAVLVRKLESSGWYLLRNGANHDIYTNGERIEVIPRHKEINEKLAMTILKRAGIS